MENEEYFSFLDSLRDSGQINMFGAEQYLQEVYGLGKHEARDVVLMWMHLHPMQKFSEWKAKMETA